jgi:probable DNA repair protein
MRSLLNFPKVFPNEVFIHLAAGLKAGVSVITPNRRLAMALKREFDGFQAARGVLVWDSADILPISAFMVRLYEDALYSDQGVHLPTLLTSAQEQVVWENVISHSDEGAALLSVPETARLAREAWEIAHSWRLIPRLRNSPLNEDCKAFQDWSRRYEKITGGRRQIDIARLGDLVAGLYASTEVSKPARLICYGFDIVTPQQARFLASLAETGCEVMLSEPQPQLESRGRNLRRVESPDREDEVYRAAVWARARIEANGAARVGIVVPALSEYRSVVMRIFDSVMEPDVRQSLPGAPRRTLPFNASLGQPLLSYPLVSAVFLILELGAGEVEFERVSLLLRSPFLAGGETEMGGRARLDANLRKRAEPTISLEALLTLLDLEDGGKQCPILAQRLSAYAKFCKGHLSDAQAPSLLAKAISDLLRVIGFPGERELDSAEYQALKKWQEVLANFASLDLVLSRSSYRGAIPRLRRMTSETMFQPETPDVPIQVLGVLEAAGMTFDCLWVMGLSAEVWPPQPRPNPFLPAELQRAAELPQGSAAATFALAHRLTDAWFSSANEVILSHPRHSGGSDAKDSPPSPLIANIAIGELALPDYPDYACLIHYARQLERIEDHTAPAYVLLQGEIEVAGGIAVIKDYVTCPFRALSLHRFGAERIRMPHAGLNAMERGTLLHYILAQAWGQLKTKSGLDSIGEKDLEAILMHGAAEAVARIRRQRPGLAWGRFAEIEQGRLIRLALGWLKEDRKRSDFAVVAIEAKRKVVIGGLTLTTRLDRVDELDDGRRIIIDYKTRAPSVTTLLGDGPEEPQLPLYLVTAEPDAVALAFAQVKAGDMRFAAVARDNDLLPGGKALSESRYRDWYGSWEDLVAAWRINLERTVAGFMSGSAKIEPRKYPDSCRHCDARPLCRVYERMESGIVDKAGED